MPRSIAAALVAITLVSPGLGAQEPSTLDGAWRATWAQGVRTQGDELVEVQRWGDAELVLSTHGDSVSGAWRALGGATWTLSGTYRNGVLHLESPGSDASDPQVARTGMRISGTLADGRLEGELWLVFPARPSAGAPRPWSAMREGVSAAPPGARAHR